MAPTFLKWRKWWRQVLKTQRRPCLWNWVLVKFIWENRTFLLYFLCNRIIILIWVLNNSFAFWYPCLKINWVFQKNNWINTNPTLHLHKKKTKAPHPVKIKAKARANKYARYISWFKWFTQICSVNLWNTTGVTNSTQSFCLSRKDDRNRSYF